MSRYTRGMQAELIERMHAKGRVTVAEAAERALVSAAAIRQWIASQRVDAVFYGGRWWVSEKSLQKEIDALEGP